MKSLKLGQIVGLIYYNFQKHTLSSIRPLRGVGRGDPSPFLFVIIRHQNDGVFNTYPPACFIRWEFWKVMMFIHATLATHLGCHLFLRNSEKIGFQLLKSYSSIHKINPDHIDSFALKWLHQFCLGGFLFDLSPPGVFFNGRQAHYISSFYSKTILWEITSNPKLTLEFVYHHWGRKWCPTPVCSVRFRFFYSILSRSIATISYFMSILVVGLKRSLSCCKRFRLDMGANNWCTAFLYIILLLSERWSYSFHFFHL